MFDADRGGAIQHTGDQTLAARAASCSHHINNLGATRQGAESRHAEASRFKRPAAKGYPSRRSRLRIHLNAAPGPALWIDKRPNREDARMDRHRFARGPLLYAAGFLGLVLAAAGSMAGLKWFASHEPELAIAPEVTPVSYSQGEGPSLSGGVGWINSGPISLQQLRGKIILLDFWTYCCINCHHVLPDLAKLEEKYKNELVVIGVHTPKFEAERDTENIRRKVHEYRIKHPVINDAKMVLWRRFGVNSWPTLVLIDPKGAYVGALSGEGHFEKLDQVIGQMIEDHKAKGDLNLTPVKFDPEIDRPDNGPLLFPGKILADAAGKRLFVTDTGHNRVVMTDLAGKNTVVIGSGEEGKADGSYEQARFNRPQGLCLDESGETLYLADTENHAIRKIDLKAHAVSTIAGTGSQSQRSPLDRYAGPAKESALSSPWDLAMLPGEKALYIAMAGPHEIWRLDLGSDEIAVWAGSGYEDIEDGPARDAKFAQPSGLATDGKYLFVADSEVSGVRAIIGIGPKGGGMVRTIVGEGLFAFGDRDGKGPAVRLQHCLGLAYGDGRLFIADTYNNRIKVCDPKTRSVKGLVGAHAAGDTDQPPRFYQPAGLSVAGSILYVADTNNHLIRMVDLNTDRVKTLNLDGLSPPKLAPRRPTFPNAGTINSAGVQARPGKALALKVTIHLPQGYHVNEAVAMPVLVETPGSEGVISPEFPAVGLRLKPPTPEFTVDLPLAKEAKAGDAFELRLSASVFVCAEKSNLCMIKSFVWNLPVKFAADGPETITLEAPPAKK